jgi:hypothetical protein
VKPASSRQAQASASKRSMAGIRYGKVVTVPARAGLLPHFMTSRDRCPALGFCAGPPRCRSHLAQGGGDGSRAARRAGNRPPTRPMPSAHFRPLHSSSGDTWNLNTTALKLLPMVDTL